MTRILKLGILIILLFCLALVGCRQTGMTVDINWPYDGLTVYATPSPISGVVSDHLAELTINNTPVVVAENGYFIGSVDLVDGKNIITVKAIRDGQENVTRTITVIYKPK